MLAAASRLFFMNSLSLATHIKSFDRKKGMTNDTKTNNLLTLLSFYPSWLFLTTYHARQRNWVCIHLHESFPFSKFLCIAKKKEEKKRKKKKEQVEKQKRVSVEPKTHVWNILVRAETVGFFLKEKNKYMTLKEKQLASEQ